MVAALFAVSQRYLRIRKRLKQFLKPIGVNGVNMRAGNHYEFAARVLNSQIQRPPEGKFLRADVHNFDRIARGNRHRGIG